MLFLSSKDRAPLTQKIQEERQAWLAKGRRRKCSESEALAAKRHGRSHVGATCPKERRLWSCTTSQVGAKSSSLKKTGQLGTREMAQLVK